MLLASNRRGPGMGLNIPHFKGSPTKRRIQPMLRLRPKSPAQDMPNAPTTWIRRSSSNAMPSCPFLQGLRSSLPALPAGMPPAPLGPAHTLPPPPLQEDVAPPPPLVQLVCPEDRCLTSHLDTQQWTRLQVPFLKTSQNDGKTDKEQVSQQAHHTLCSLVVQKDRVDTDGLTGGWESSAMHGAARPHGR